MLKQTAQYIIDTTSKLAPLSLLQQLTNVNVIFPYYHIVNNDSKPHVKHLYTYPDVEKFKRDLEWLTKYYQPVSLNKIIDEAKSGSKNDIKSFHLTFDDGFKEIKDIIAPILESKGIPATFFINTAFLDNKSMYYRNKASLIIDKLNLNELDKEQSDQIKKLTSIKELNPESLKNFLLSITYDRQQELDQIATLCHIDIDKYLEQQKPYLNSNEVQNLIDKGFTIGAHSIDQPFYKNITYQEQLRQTLESTNDIQEQFNLNYRAFAFPFSDMYIKKQFFETIYNQHDIDITFGTSGLNKEEFRGNYQRIWMENTQKEAPLIIKGRYLINLIKKSISIHKIKRT